MQLPLLCPARSPGRSAALGRLDSCCFPRSGGGKRDRRAHVQVTAPCWALPPPVTPASLLPWPLASLCCVRAWGRRVRRAEIPFLRPASRGRVGASLPPLPAPRGTPPEGESRLESCCWQAGVPQANGSSAQRRGILAPLSLNEGVALSCCFSVVPVLVLRCPPALRAGQGFPWGEKEQERKRGVEG